MPPPPPPPLPQPPVLCCLQADVPAEVRSALEVVPCQRLEEVLAAAFEPPLCMQQEPLMARL